MFRKLRHLLVGRPLTVCWVIARTSLSGADLNRLSQPLLAFPQSNYRGTEFRNSGSKSGIPWNSVPDFLIRNSANSTKGDQRVISVVKYAIVLMIVPNKVSAPLQVGCTLQGSRTCIRSPSRSRTLFLETTSAIFIFALKARFF